MPLENVPTLSSPRPARPTVARASSAAAAPPGPGQAQQPAVQRPAPRGRSASSGSGTARAGSRCGRRVSRSPAGAPEDHGLAAGRAGQAEQQLDRGGLARPVGPEEPEDLAPADRHRQAGQRDRAPVLLAQLDRVAPPGTARCRRPAPGGAGRGPACGSADLAGDMQDVRLGSAGRRRHARPRGCLPRSPAAATAESVSSTAGAPPTVTCRLVMPGGTGTGSAVVPSIRISWARLDGRPGRDSRNASSWPGGRAGRGGHRPLHGRDHEGGELRAPGRAAVLGHDPGARAHDQCAAADRAASIPAEPDRDGQPGLDHDPGHGGRHRTAGWPAR